MNLLLNTGVELERSQTSTPSPRVQATESVSLFLVLDGNPTLLLSRLLPLVGRHQVEVHPLSEENSSAVSPDRILVCVPAQRLAAFESELKQQFLVVDASSNGVQLLLREPVALQLRLTLFMNAADCSHAAKFLTELSLLEHLDVEQATYSSGNSWGRLQVKLSVAEGLLADAAWKMLLPLAKIDSWQLVLQDRHGKVLFRK